MFDLSSAQIRVIRGRLIFTAGIVALYQPFGKHGMRFGIQTYAAALGLTLIAIWMPRKYRLVAYYISVAMGAFVLGSWQWLITSPHTIPTDYLIPAVVILAGAPNRMRNLSIGLTGGIVLLAIAGGPYPSDLWNGVAQVGIYMGVRSIRGRREMEALRQRYVKELEEALTELQAAQAKLETNAAQSMHYAAQAERFRIARDIHDGLGHQLTSLVVQLQALTYMIPDTLDEIKQRVPKLLEVARAGLAEVRQSVRDWEEADDNYGLTALTAVIEEFKSTTNTSVDFVINVDEQEVWPSNIQIVLYRVLQETLSNAVRHANASHIQVTLTEGQNKVNLVVTDNGENALKGELKPGFGLRNMKARCEEICGSCQWHVRPDGGVTVEVSLPLGTDTKVV